MTLAMDTVCNFRYARVARGGAGISDVRGLLQYLQYRNDRDGHISASGPDRWIDGGLGTRYQFILQRLNELSPANPHAFCHSIVVSPDPKEMVKIEGDPHARFADAVLSSLEEWEAWRQTHDEKPQVGGLEYSVVIHRPERDYGEQIHAHVILAAATEDGTTGEFTPLYNNREHIDQFKEIAARQLDRVYGLDKEQERDWPEPEPEPEKEIDLDPEMELEIEFFPLHHPDIEELE